MNKEELFKKEATAFDNQSDERIKHGFIPDLRRLHNVKWFYNNVWREPEFVKIHLIPRINFALDIARSRGGEVIELGCGYGYLTLELARYGLVVVGVDISPRSIEIAQKFADENKYKENFGSLTYKCKNILTMDLGDNEFDTVIFFNTLHHISDINLLLEKIYISLKKGGNLIVCEPVRENFTRESAEFAAILRAVLPTWIPYEEKLQDLDNPKAWKHYVKEIYKEYKYVGEHKQSPFDNISSSEEVMINTIEKYFEIKTIKYSDAFIDKLIGGLRGEDRYLLAKFLKFLDDELIRKKILLHTRINVHAIKK